MADQQGFTFVELIVSMALIVMVAAVVTPALTGSLDRTRVNEGAKRLATLATAITTFKNDVGRYPGQLSHLSTGITTSQLNNCGSFYTNGNVVNWAGPYYQETVLVDGGSLPVFVGTAQDQLVRIALANPNALLGISVVNVRLEDVLALDRSVDGTNGQTSGTIQWDAANAEAMTTMRYLIPVSGC